MLFIGIDPDLHCTAIGGWYAGKPWRAWTIETPRVKGRVEQAAVLDMVWAIKEQFPLFPKSDILNIVWTVEAQTLHVTGLKQHKRPQDIVTLGNVAGAILGYISMLETEPSKVLFPTAKEWKGSIPKAVMQARFYTKLGWGYQRIGKDYSRPLKPDHSLSNITGAKWKHVGDALMLAEWASKNWRIQK